MERIICLAIGYLFGMFQTSYIIGKIHHMDIRQYGSGNAGTTNALRVLGKKAGVIVLLGDVAKTVLAVVLVKVIADRNLMLVKGAVPGKKGGVVRIRPAIKGQDK